MKINSFSRRVGLGILIIALGIVFLDQLSQSTRGKPAKPAGNPPFPEIAGRSALDSAIPATPQQNMPISTQAPREGTDQQGAKDGSMNRIEQKLARIREIGRLYQPPVMIREEVLAYLAKFPGDPETAVWASLALMDPSLLPPGGEPIAEWGRLWFDLHKTKNTIDDGMLDRITRWHLTDPPNALPNLLLALRAAQEGNSSLTIRYITDSGSGGINDHSEDIHGVTRAYLAQAGASASEQLRFQIEFNGADPVVQALRTSLSALQSRQGISDMEKRDLQAAKLQLASLDYSPMGISLLRNYRQSEAYSVGQLGVSLSDYMPGGSREEVTAYMAQLNAERGSVDRLYELRNYIYERAAPSIAEAFQESRSTSGEVPALMEWLRREEVGPFLKEYSAGVPQRE